MKTADRIIAGATKLFLRKGVKIVTMDDIAVHLGMSKRTIYEHFATKKDLLIACLDNNHAIQQHKHEFLDGKDVNIFEIVFHIFFYSDEEHKRIRKFVDDMRQYYPEIVEERFERHCDEAIQKMQSGLECSKKQGLVNPDINVETASHVILEALYDVVSRPSVLPDPKVTKEKALEFIIIYFFRGIASEKGLHLIDELIKRYKINN